MSKAEENLEGEEEGEDLIREKYAETEARIDDISFDLYQIKKIVKMGFGSVGILLSLINIVLALVIFFTLPPSLTALETDIVDSFNSVSQELVGVEEGCDSAANSAGDLADVIDNVNALANIGQTLGINISPASTDNIRNTQLKIRDIKNGITPLKNNIDDTTNSIKSVFGNLKLFITLICVVIILSSIILLGISINSLL
ncbi:hypothetical protein KO465_01145 [Candidatus Micrarchaeota archaeon]|jgi:hypothetical protein|nr:hypothetical protein [Candidatus Micrarchaeota archaeon]